MLNKIISLVDQFISLMSISAKIESQAYSIASQRS